MGERESEEESEMGTSSRGSYHLKQGDKEEVARRHPSGRRKKKKGKRKGNFANNPLDLSVTTKTFKTGTLVI